jgi:hypothetical protein
MVNYLKELVHEKNHHQLALAIIFLIYIFLNVKMPHMIAEGVSSMLGTVVVVVVALGLLSNSNPILGILGIVVAYLLIERSNQQMKSKSSVATVMEKEMEKMDTFFKVENQFPKTLEEEVVEKRTLHKSKRDTIGPSYKPLLSELPGSTSL